MQFLVVVQVKKEYVENPPPGMTGALSEEQEQGRRLYGRGDLRQSWEIDGDRPGVVCLYEAASQEDLRALLDTYVMIQNGDVDVLTIALKPDSAYVTLSAVSQ